MPRYIHDGIGAGPVKCHFTLYPLYYKCRELLHRNRLPSKLGATHLRAELPRDSAEFGSQGSVKRLSWIERLVKILRLEE